MKSSLIASALALIVTVAPLPSYAMDASTLTPTMTFPETAPEPTRQPVSKNLTGLKN